MASAALAIFVLASAALADESSVAPEDVPDVLIKQHGTRLPRVSGPAEDYSRNCQGCHGHLGYSVNEVPRLRDRVGFFTHTAEGRAYLVQVPNVLQAHLSDARLAAMLNWMLETYSRAELVRDFQPYSETEVSALRKQRLESVITRRREVIEGLVRNGVIPSAETLAFSLEPGRY